MQWLFVTGWEVESALMGMGGCAPVGLSRIKTHTTIKEGMAL